MASGHCPECGVSLEKRSPRKHALSHYPEYLPELPTNLLARQRQAALYKMQAVQDRDRAEQGQERQAEGE